jgi:hypothetical protein
MVGLLDIFAVNFNQVYEMLKNKEWEGKDICFYIPLKLIGLL